MDNDKAPELDYERLSRDLSDAVIELNDQRYKLLAILKAVVDYDKSSDLSKWTKIVDDARAAIKKYEDGAGRKPDSYFL